MTTPLRRNTPLQRHPCSQIGRSYTNRTRPADRTGSRLTGMRPSSSPVRGWLLVLVVTVIASVGFAQLALPSAGAVRVAGRRDGARPDLPLGAGHAAARVPARAGTGRGRDRVPGQAADAGTPRLRLALGAAGHRRHPGDQPGRGTAARPAPRRVDVDRRVRADRRRRVRDRRARPRARRRRPGGHGRAVPEGAARAAGDATGHHGVLPPAQRRRHADVRPDAVGARPGLRGRRRLRGAAAAEGGPGAGDRAARPDAGGGRDLSERRARQRGGAHRARAARLRADRGARGAPVHPGQPAQHRPDAARWPPS